VSSPYARSLTNLDDIITNTLSNIHNLAYHLPAPRSIARALEVKLSLPTGQLEDHMHRIKEVMHLINADSFGGRTWYNEEEHEAEDEVPA
jgi:hypothetical protein